MLKKSGYTLLPHYEDLQQEYDNEKNMVWISKKGKPEIVVMERCNDLTKSQIGSKFPPEGAVEFFRLSPNP
jgi:hypothetical protein